MLCHSWPTEGQMDILAQVQHMNVLFSTIILYEQYQSKLCGGNKGILNLRFNEWTFLLFHLLHVNDKILDFTGYFPTSLIVVWSMCLVWGVSAFILWTVHAS